jgi:glyoxylase-like metal-dependent hydrolase (beta-lactamase superfamily II)
VPVKVHALQTGTVAIKERQQHGLGFGLRRRVNTLLDRAWTGPLPIYAWAIEHPEGLIVVDTGETARATRPGYFPSWNPYFRFGVRERVRPEEEIGERLRVLGVPPREVRWLVLTHLHTDHAGGLAHFQGVEILVTRTEYHQASGLGGQARGYLPQHWPTWFAPRQVAFHDGPVGLFPRSHRLTRAGDVVLVPTPGHTAGHLSVLVHDGQTTLFLAGDASYTEALMLATALDGVAPREEMALATLTRIGRYARAAPMVYLPSHDPGAAARLAARQTVPVGQARS